VSGWPHDAHGAPFKGAPHSVQNRPVPGAEQRGQTVGVGCGWSGDIVPVNLDANALRM
jgi:hypothetical protein